MSAKAEVKGLNAGEAVAAQVGGADDAKNNTTEVQKRENPARKTEATETPEKFKATLAELDEQRTALAKSAIEQLKPGRPFDPVVVRQINKIETKKNRLIVSRFASLLRKNNPAVQAIVHQIIEI
ncbi:hypothetical protein [Paraburkholderia lycopersici]|uniref:Uncharacterized protein n=1 Tax=Paraburkholderia lycopersici TaxID=416944 RepID=A0A1G6GVR6_9BURK|nr:hypothetical protein [Paraburkholderia lycopersici]SDB85775.1 hypothetical protein SAMN05421548_101362 [Paraburkholderia lycopersici]